MNKNLFVLPALCAFLAACSSFLIPPTTTATVTSTAYVPLERGTPLPLIYQPIRPGTASSLTLLARWSSVINLPKHLAFMPESNKLLVGRQVWNVADGLMEGEVREDRIETNNSELSVTYSPNGQFTAVTNKNWSFRVIDRSSPERYLYFYLDQILGSTFLPDSKNIAIFLSSGEIWFVSTENWAAQLQSMEDGSSYGSVNLRPDLFVNVGVAPEEVVFSENSSTMAVVVSGRKIQIWDVPTLTRQLVLENVDQATHLALHPNGEIVAFGASDHRIQLWDTRTGEMLIDLEGHRGNIKSLAFSPDGLLLASVDDQKGVYMWGILPDPDPRIAAMTATAFDQHSTLPTGTPVALPAATVTPTSILPDYATLSWPVAAPTEDQTTEVRQCNIDVLAETRYPEVANYWQIAHVFNPKSACDWAVLAVAYQNRQQDKESVSEEGKRAFFQAIKLNPAFALQTNIFYNYFDSMDTVSAPSVSRQPIKNISIEYQWNGIGEPSQIEYKIKIVQADLPESIVVTVKAQPQDLIDAMNKDIDPTFVQAIGPAMVNFVPIQSFFKLETCTDNSPDWKADITFSDGTNVELNTNNSNLLAFGGPWQARIGGQGYMQFSTDLLVAFSDLFNALGLPLGQPMGMFCAQEDTFQLAFP